jgi:hypothetical protein
MPNDSELPQLTPRGRDFLEWLKQQDQVTTQQLNSKMRQIHEHYNNLEKKENK